jgi:hypothetical protein
MMINMTSFNNRDVKHDVYPAQDEEGTENEQNMICKVHCHHCAESDNKSEQKPNDHDFMNGALLQVEQPGAKCDLRNSIEDEKERRERHELFKIAAEQHEG